MTSDMIAAGILKALAIGYFLQAILIGVGGFLYLIVWHWLSERRGPKAFSVDRWKQANMDVTGICPPNEQITAVIAVAKQKGWMVIA